MRYNRIVSIAVVASVLLAQSSICHDHNHDHDHDHSHDHHHD